MDTAAGEQLFVPPNVISEDAGNGSVILRSADTLGTYPTTVMHSVRTWADLDPDHPLVAQRGPGGAWRSCSYGAAVAAADGIGQALLDRGLGPDRPLLALTRKTRTPGWCSGDASRRTSSSPLVRTCGSGQCAWRCCRPPPCCPMW